MTVQDLINRLQKFPPNVEVVIRVDYSIASYYVPYRPTALRYVEGKGVQLFTSQSFETK